MVGYFGNAPSAAASQDSQACKHLQTTPHTTTATLDLDIKLETDSA